VRSFEGKRGRKIECRVRRDAVGTRLRGVCCDPVELLGMPAPLFCFSRSHLRLTNKCRDGWQLETVAGCRLPPALPSVPSCRFPPRAFPLPRRRAVVAACPRRASAVSTPLPRRRFRFDHPSHRSPIASSPSPPGQPGVIAAGGRAGSASSAQGHDPGGSGAEASTCRSLTSCSLSRSTFPGCCAGFASLWPQSGFAVRGPEPGLSPRRRGIRLALANDLGLSRGSSPSLTTKGLSA